MKILPVASSPHSAAMFMDRDVIRRYSDRLFGRSTKHLEDNPRDIQDARRLPARTGVAQRQATRATSSDVSADGVRNEKAQSPGRRPIRCVMSAPSSPSPGPVTGVRSIPT